MRFSKNEIEVLLYVVGFEGFPYRMDLSKTLDLHPETISRVVTRLENKGLLARERQNNPGQNPLYYRH
jgi:uncharacterized membrane protein